MIKVSIIGLAQTMDKIKRLEEQVKTKAMVSAINKTATQTKNLATRLIRKSYLVKSEDLKDKIIIQKASKNRLEALVISKKKGGGIELTKYSARMTRKGLSVKVKRSGGRSVIPNAFIGQGSAFVREGEKTHIPRKGYWAGKTIKRGERKGEPILRQRLKKLYGPTIADLMGSKDIELQLYKFARVKVVEIFMNEVRFYMKREFNQ